MNLYKHLLLSLKLIIHGQEILMQTQKCDSSQFLYQGVCIQKSCLFTKLSRISIEPQDVQENTQITGIQYQLELVNETNESAYRVIVSYADQEDNQIVSDPEGCIDWRIYQTKNKYQFNHTRLHMNNSEGIPSWPNPNYEYNRVLKCGQISFEITQNDMSTHQCQHFTQGNLIQRNCYFELSFVIYEQVQMQYYFSFSVILEKNNEHNSLINITYSPIRQVQQCKSYDNNNICQFTTDISSSLLYLATQSCQNLSRTPYYYLEINKPFYLFHQLDDPAFKGKSNIKLNAIELYFQSFNYEHLMGQDEFTLLAMRPGFNIYKIVLPIVYENIQIQVVGQIQQTPNVQSSQRYIIKSEIIIGTTLDNTTQQRPRSLQIINSPRNCLT